MWKKLGIALACVFGLALLCTVSATPAAALCSLCDCNSGCDDYCVTGPDDPHCPGCNESTCGESGICSTNPICDPVSCANLTCTTSIYGNSANNTLNGTASRECIYGQGGNDTIDGNAGDDRIWGGTGTDTLYGDSGDDCLWGEDGDDHLDGESGHDFGDGGTGTDVCTSATDDQVNC